MLLLRSLKLAAKVTKMESIYIINFGFKDLKLK